MLKIQRRANGKVVFTLSGRIETEDIEELRRLLELERTGGHIAHIAFDLKDVTLVDRDAIRFLTDCEANNVQLEDCPPYVRKRIQQQIARPGRKKRNLRVNEVQREEGNGRE